MRNLYSRLKVNLQRIIAHAVKGQVKMLMQDLFWVSWYTGTYTRIHDICHSGQIRLQL